MWNRMSCEVDNLDLADSIHCKGPVFMNAVGIDCRGDNEEVK